ncbi:MFS transporter [Micromonospora sp. LOL_014]|uniref:MFS transporter n=1 Tax=Micromonospora sp. LOL_014 TaxID=3345415 RepID=UPI003A8A59AC
MWTLLRTNRRFRRIFAGNVVTSFGESAVYLSLAIWVKDLTGSNAAAGIVFLTIAAPGLFAPLLGHVVDRVSRRRLMIGMDLGMAVLFLSLLAVRDAGQVWIIYLVTFAYGVFSASPAPPALLKDVLPSADAAAARSLILATGEGVRIVSPVAGAAVYVAFGGGALAMFGTVTFTVAALLLVSVQVVESAPEPAAERFRTSVAAGFRFVATVPILLRLAATTLAFMTVVGMLETAIFAANQGLGRPAAFLGVITSVQGAGSVAGGLVAGAAVRRWGEVRATGAGYALIAVGLLLCLAGDVPLFLVGVAAFGLGLPFVVISLGTALHLYTPARMQGRVNAAVSSVTGTAQAVSIAVGAALIGVLGYHAMYLIMAATAVLCAVSLLAGRVARPEVAPSVADDDSAAAGLEPGAGLEPKVSR